MNALLPACCLLAAALPAGACLEWEGGMGSGWPVCSAVQGDLLLLGEWRAMFTADLSDPAHPDKLASVYFPDYVSSIAVQGTFAYVAVNMEGLWVVDVADRMAPRIVNHLPTPSPARTVIVDRPLLVVSLMDVTKRFYDLSDPAQPVLLEGIAEWAYPCGLAWPYFIACARTDSESVLVLWDFTDPRHPRELSRTPLGARVNAAYLGIDWPQLYLHESATSGGDPCLDIWNLTDPAQPVRVGVVDGFQDGPLAAQHSFLFTDHREGWPGYPCLRSWDVSDPLHPQVAGEWGCFSKYTYAFTIAFPFAVVAENYPERYVVLNVDPAMEPLSAAIPSSGSYPDARAGEAGLYALRYRDGLFHLEVLDYHSPDAIGVSGEVPLDLYESNLYPLNASTVFAYSYGGMEAVDVSDPRHPLLAGAAAIPNQTAHLAGMAVSGSHAFIACTSFVAVMDIADPLHPRYLGSFDSPAPGVIYNSVLGVAASGSLLVVGSQDRLDILDASDHLHPSWLSSAFSRSRFSALKVKDHLAFTLEEGSGLHIYDFCTPNHVVQVGWLDLPGYAPGGLLVKGDRAVLTAFSSTREYLLLIDVSDPLVPRLLALRGTSPDVIQMDVFQGHLISSGVTLDLFDLSDCNHGRPLDKP